jgi:hypothetical protein
MLIDDDPEEIRFNRDNKKMNPDELHSIIKTIKVDGKYCTS